MDDAPRLTRLHGSAEPLLCLQERVVLLDERGRDTTSHDMADLIAQAGAVARIPHPNCICSHASLGWCHCRAGKAVWCP